MPARDLVLALAATGCAFNPDPRTRPIDKVALDGHGGWIVVTRRSGAETAGELIAVDPDAIRVLTPAALVAIERPAIVRARLWAWDAEHGGYALWGTAGTLSTVSHGFFLILSAPVWVLTTTITSSVESRASIVDYPDHGWDKLAVWARFPQGMPPGLHGNDLVRQRRPPPGPPAPPPPPPPEQQPPPDAEPPVL
ncbi:MAG TPA: hypothetical protein VK607_25090 [Kofleriaceae bacterium]|nr:hypothetical protein [Kofleriaceae bacterium]